MTGNANLGSGDASSNSRQSAEETARDIGRATGRHFSAENKIRILMGLRGEAALPSCVLRSRSQRSSAAVAQ